jgi:hypothetical protein
MPRTTSAERYNMRFRRLNFGSITLVPVYDRDEYPYSAEWNRDMWHVPGRKYLSTDALVKLATEQGITVSLTESNGTTVETTRLN